MCSIQTIAMPQRRSCLDRVDELGRLGVGEPGADLVEEQHPRVRSPARGPVRAACDAAGRGCRRGGWPGRSGRTCRAPRRSGRRRRRARRPRARRGADEDVLEDGHAAERPWDLVARGRCRAGTAFRPRSRVMSSPRKWTVPAFGALRAGEHVEQRRLARAVRADDADRLARADRKSTPVEDHERDRNCLRTGHAGEERARCPRSSPVPVAGLD